MANPFQHSAMKDLLGRVSLAFKENRVWMLGHNQLVFVCGGPMGAGADSVRRRFMDWAQAHIEGFRFFLAEAAARDVIANAEPSFLNLSQFEYVLADVADCIVVIPESVGSWAETGYFSALHKIRRKCLVINDTGQQGPSFLNTGPIQTISETSIYRPTYHVDFTHQAVDFGDVITRIRQYARSNKKRLKAEDFNGLSGHQQFAVVHYIVSIFPSMDIEGLVFIIKTLFSKYRKARVEQVVSILVSVGYFGREQADQSRFYAVGNILPLLEIENVNREDLLAETFSIFEKVSPELIPTAEQQNAA